MQVQQAVPEAKARGLASTVVEILTELRMVLGSVSNAASVQAAGRPLRELRERLETPAPQIEALEPWDRAGIAEVVARGMPSVRSHAERIANLQGIEVLRPDLEAVVARLRGWVR
jgi:hypothetical protein